MCCLFAVDCTSQYRPAGKYLKHPHGERGRRVADFACGEQLLHERGRNVHGLGVGEQVLDDLLAELLHARLHLGRANRHLLGRARADIGHIGWCEIVGVEKITE